MRRRSAFSRRAAEGVDVLGADVLEALTGAGRGVAVDLAGRSRGVGRVRMVAALAGLAGLSAVMATFIVGTWLVL